MKEKCIAGIKFDSNSEKLSYLFVDKNLNIVKKLVHIDFRKSRNEYDVYYRSNILMSDLRECNGEIDVFSRIHYKDVSNRNIPNYDKLYNEPNPKAEIIYKILKEKCKVTNRRSDKIPKKLNLRKIEKALEKNGFLEKKTVWKKKDYCLLRDLWIIILGATNNTRTCEKVINKLRKASKRRG